MKMTLKVAAVAGELNTMRRAKIATAPVNQVLNRRQSRHHAPPEDNASCSSYEDRIGEPSNILRPVMKVELQKEEPEDSSPLFVENSEAIYTFNFMRLG